MSITANSVAVNLEVSPRSLNAIAGQKAMFCCVANNNLTISWRTYPILDDELIQEGTTNRSNVTFIVPNDPHINCIQVYCMVTDLETRVTMEQLALLSVQGILYFY